MAKISLGTAVTDSNGIARLVDGYTGTGAGEVDVSAEVTLSGSTFVSEPYQICDAIYYDKALSGTGNYNDAIWQKNNATLTRQDDGSLVNFSANYGSIGLGTTTSTEDVYINDGLILEFDLVERNGNGNVQWKRSSDNGFDAMPSYIGHHKHTIYKNKQLFTVNDEILYKGWVTKDLGNYIRISVYGANSEVSVKFANFRIYPI